MATMVVIVAYFPFFPLVLYLPVSLLPVQLLLLPLLPKFMVHDSSFKVMIIDIACLYS